MTIDKQHLNQNMKRLMKERKFKIKHLAFYSNVSMKTIERMMQGRGKPYVDTVIKILNALKCKFEDLFREKDE